MAAKLTLCFACVVLFSMVDSQTTQSLNGTQPSTSDQGTDEGSVLDKSMTAFYNMVKGFLGVVQPKKIKDQSWINLTALINGDTSSFNPSDWQQYSNYLVGFAICFAVGILFIIIMPIVGCCFCCCRCCNRCGGRKKVYDPKRAKCKRISYCTVLLILNTIMLAGVVCAFVANDLIHQYLRNQDNRGPVGKIDSALNGIVGYVNNTVDDVQDKALNAFDNTRNQLIRDINNTGSNAVENVTDLINATRFINAAENLSKDVEVTQQELLNVQFYLANLQENGTALTTNLSMIKQRIENICSSSCQNDVDTTQYETDANFTGLNDLSTEAGNVAKSINMSTYIAQAKETINKAKAEATANIQTQINGATGTLDSIRGDIDTKIKEFKNQISSTTRFASDGSATLNRALTPEVEKYYDYVWYAGFGICGVFLLIVLCYYIGVLYGICGERPGHDAQCCNKGSGANFLMAGVGFSFIFSWLLMLLTMLFFVIGGPTYTEVCQYFDKHDPQEIKFISDAINTRFDLAKMLYNDSSVDLNIVSVLENCKENKPIYEAMKLDHLVNLSSLIDLSIVDEKIDDIAKQNFNLGNISIVDDELKQRIQEFGKSGLDRIPFDDFDTQMSAKLTKADLSELATKLRTAAGKTSEPLKGQLEEEATKLDSLQNTYVRNMESDVVNLNRSLTRLKTHMNIQSRTQSLIDGLTQAQTTFNTNSSALVKELIQTLAKNLKTTAKTNVDSLIKDVTETAGKCRPVFDAVFQVTDAVCKTVLDPFNSLWFSWGWCLFFFIPSIIFAVKLAGLYRREEEYTEKDFDDANFSMYGGDVRSTDTIPLTSIDQHGGSGYPGVANTGYHQYDNGHHGGRHGYSNGYRQSNGYPGSKDPPPPEYNGGGHSAYPPNYDYRGRHENPHYPPRY